MSSPGTVPAARRPSWWRPRSLSTRLLVVTISLVAVVSILVAAATTLSLRKFLLDRLDDQLSRSVMFLETQPEHAPGDALCQLSDQLVFGAPVGQLNGTLDPACQRAIVLTSGGGFRDVAAPDLAAIADLPPDGSLHSINLDGLGNYRVAVFAAGPQVVAIGVPTADIDATVRTLVGWITLFIIAGVALAGLAATLALRRQLAPLRKIAATAQHVSRMPLGAGSVGVTARVPDDLVDPTTEVGQVGAALNTLLSHVESALDARHDSEQQVRQFVADASHELRTPLSTIQGYAELSLHNPAADDDAMRHAMGKVETESARMATLVNDLLLLARLDSGRPIERVEVDLSRLVVEAVNDARVVDPDRTYQLSLPNDPVLVVGDEERLHQVVGNLLSNVRRHTPEGTTVAVSAELVTATRFVRLRVHDDGPGMPESLRGREFERFTRGDSSRTRESGGAGLGLSIVQAIVTAHGGSVAVDSEPGNTSVVLTLPSVGAVAWQAP